MRGQAFVGIGALLLVSCANPPVKHSEQARKPPRFDTVRDSADHSLQLRLFGGHPNFRYELTERESGKLLARAESALNIDNFSFGEFRGEQTVLLSDDNRAICVVENFGESSPAKRYILLRKTPSGRYSTRYLNPGLQPDASIMEFGGDFPTVIALTGDTITFSQKNGNPFPQLFAKIPVFPKPQSATY